MTYPALDLTGKVALVTGGNSGIGLGMAEALAQAGASLCVWGTSDAKNASAGDQLRAHGGRVLTLRCDVSEEAAVERAFAETVAQLGRVDACFANAGVSGLREVTAFVEMTTTEWRRVRHLQPGRGLGPGPRRALCRDEGRRHLDDEVASSGAGRLRGARQRDRARVDRYPDDRADAHSQFTRNWLKRRRCGKTFPSPCAALLAHHPEIGNYLGPPIRAGI